MAFGSYYRLASKLSENPPIPGISKLAVVVQVDLDRSTDSTSFNLQTLEHSDASSSHPAIRTLAPDEARGSKHIHHQKCADLVLDHRTTSELDLLTRFSKGASWTRDPDELADLEILRPAEVIAHLGIQSSLPGGDRTPECFLGCTLDT